MKTLDRTFSPHIVIPGGWLEDEYPAALLAGFSVTAPLCFSVTAAPQYQRCAHR
jgi:hypothetical protein